MKYRGSNPPIWSAAATRISTSSIRPSIHPLCRGRRRAVDHAGEEAVPDRRLGQAVDAGVHEALTASEDDALHWRRLRRVSAKGFDHLEAWRVRPARQE